MDSSETMRLKLMHTSLLDTCGLWFDVECAAQHARWSVRPVRSIRRARVNRHRVAVAAQPGARQRASRAAVQQSRPSRSHRGHR
jgi:hypothetical protein